MTLLLSHITRLSRTALVAVSALIAVDTSVAMSAGMTRQAAEKIAKLCTNQTSSLEQSEEIPAHLLTAISLTETGKWQKGSREILAWPWTVTAHGRGQHFETKEEAQMEVEILMTTGVRNIDVGCMQINLKYHDEAFESLSEALDPKANTAYAAKFLKKLYAQKKDWMQAVGAYHSSTPDKNLKYRTKLTRLWNKTRGDTGTQLASGQTLTASVTQKNVKTAAAKDIDHERIRALNKMFKTRRDSDPVANTEKDRFMKAAMQRHEELNAWREAQVKGIDTRHWATMRRAQRNLREQQALDTRDKPSFDERRQQQLGAWREFNLWVPTK